MPISETGHARNMQYFQELIAFVDSWGGTYTPSNNAILKTALQAKRTAADGAMTDVTTNLADLKTVVNDRENTFSPVKKLTTRVVNFYESTGAEPNAIKDIRSLKRKIDGKRAKKVVDDPNTPEDESQNTISASQQSYTQLIEHFDNIIELLGNDPLYDPNEDDITIVTLQGLSTDMKNANEAVINNNVSLSNARGSRDDAMYAEDTGLVDLALTVKKYVKAAFGTSSLQYSQISGLIFTRPKKS